MVSTKTMTEEETIPLRWTWKDVERITKREMIDMYQEHNEVVCVLDNGIKFRFARW